MKVEIRRRYRSKGKESKHQSDCQLWKYQFLPALTMAWIWLYTALSLTPTPDHKLVYTPARATPLFIFKQACRAHERKKGDSPRVTYKRVLQRT